MSFSSAQNLAADDRDLHPVVELLRERALSGSRPGARTDPFRIGLVIEGGAMRGVISGGMVTALEALGLRDAFDVVYGSSSGACAGAYFLAGQARSGTHLYFQAVNNRRFINLLRGLRGQPVVDLAHLFDNILPTELPLDFPTLASSGIKLVVLASRVDGNEAIPLGPVEPTHLTDFADADDLMAALHASGRIPVAGGPPVEYRGMRFWDAAITQPIPLHAALADGCTHLLVLMTLPRGARRRPLRLLDRLLMVPRIASVSPGLAATHQSGPQRYQATCRQIFEHHDSHTGPPYIAGLTVPPTMRIVSRLEIRADRLIVGARAGGEAVLAAFGNPDARLSPELQIVDRAGAPLDLRLTPR